MQFSVCTKNQYTHFANQKISIGPVHLVSGISKTSLTRIIIKLGQHGLMVSSTVAVEKHDQKTLFSFIEGSCSPAARENWLSSLKGCYE